MLPWRPSTRKQSKTHAVFSNYHPRPVLGCCSYTSDEDEDDLIWVSPCGQWVGNLTLPSSCRGSLLQLLWLLLLLLLWLQNYTDRGYQGAAEVKNWNGLLLSSSEGSTWVTSCSHPIVHLNFGGPSKSGWQNRVSAYYVSLFLSLFMSLFVTWFVELCLLCWPPSLVWCCVSAAIYS